MNSERWFAAATAVVELQLLGIACFTLKRSQQCAIWTRLQTSLFRAPKASPGPRASCQPYTFAAVEEFVFGALAPDCAVGLFRRSAWARRVLVRASVAFALVAVVVIALTLGQWDIQGAPWRHEPTVFQFRDGSPRLVLRPSTTKLVAFGLDGR
jgi:hypothetical protein